VNRKTLPVGEQDDQDHEHNDDDDKKSDEKPDLLLVRGRFPLGRHTFMLLK
jgi:hypothetical protein